MREAPQTVVSKVLEPGESLVWSARPDVEVLCEYSAGSQSLLARLFGPQRGQSPGGHLVLIAGLVIAELVLWPRRDALPVLAIVPGIGALLLALVLVGASLRRRSIRRWAERLTYAITDRRVLVLEGDVVTDAYTPEKWPGSRRVDRGPRHADLLFETITSAGERWKRAPDPSRVPKVYDGMLHYERSRKAFKALPDADVVQGRLQDWSEAHRRETERAFRQYVESSDSELAEPEPPAGARRITNARIGLTVSLPDTWRVQVRARRKPSGASAVDLIDWRDYDGSDDWNTLYAEGPARLAVGVELMETPTPTLTLRSLRGGWLGRILGGKVVNEDHRVRLGAFSGFSVTSAAPMSHGRMLQRNVALHDGKRQLVLSAAWARGTPQAEELLESVLASIRVV